MSVNVLSTKVLIEDMIFTSLRLLEMGPPPHVVIRATQRSSCLQGKYAAPLFSVILRPLVLALGIEHETFRSAVKRVDCKTVVFSSKSVKESVKRWVRLFRARSSRAWNALRACQARDCFQPRSKHFVWLPTRIWIRKKTDCFAVYQARHRLS